MNKLERLFGKMLSIHQFVSFHAGGILLLGFRLGTRPGNIKTSHNISGTVYITKEGSIKHDATFHFFVSNLYNYLELIEIKNNIKTLNVKGEGLQNPQEFRELWRRYTPAEILSTYGNPSRITIQTRKNTIQPSESTYKYYDLSLFYDHLGFVIVYSGKIENKPNYAICPTYSGNLLEEISIYSQSSESAATLENIIGEDYGPNESAYSLLEASGLTIDQLANLITDKTRTACFDTKPEIWPP